MNSFQHAWALLPALVLSCAQAVAAGVPVHAAAVAGAPSSPTPPSRKSGVVLTHAIEGTGKPGSEVVVRLAFQPPHAPQGATVRYTLEGPATRLSADTKPLPSGQAGARVVRVRIDGNEAPVYLHVHTAQGGRTGVTSIALSQPGARAKLSQSAAARSMPAEAPLVVLPGQLR